MGLIVIENEYTIIDEVVIENDKFYCHFFISSMVELLKCHDCDQHDLGSKSTCTILLHFLGKTLYGTFSCLASSSKFQSYP